MKILSGDMDKYLKDESNSKSSNISAVYIPETTEELSKIIKAGENTPFTIYGGGTGITAGAIADKGSIISTEKLKKIEINPNEKRAFVQAGVLLKELHEQAAKHNLWFPVDSTEQTATLGGNIATNASGTRSFKYGNIRNFIDELKIILASGDTLLLKRGQVMAGGTKFYFNLGKGKVKFNIMDISGYFKFKNSSGYYMNSNMDLVDLLIGSEGTLGIVSEAGIKLLPRPYEINAFMIDFVSMEEAFDFVKAVKENKKDLSAISLEFIDQGSLALIRDKFSNLDKFRILVFVEIEAADSQDSDAKMEKFSEFLDKNGIWEKRVLVSATNEKKNFIYQVREAVPNAVNEYIRQKKLTKVSTDFAVADAEFDKMTNIYAHMLKYTKIRHVMFGHAGDNNLHINFLPENDKEHAEALVIYDDMAKEIIKLKGTISAEHGVGKMKKKYLADMYGADVINKMREIKAIFDPKGILNPGNIFDLGFL